MEIVDTLLNFISKAFDTARNTVNDVTASTFGKGIIDTLASSKEDPNVKIKKALNSVKLGRTDDLMENLDKLNDYEKASFIQQYYYSLQNTYKDTIEKNNNPKLLLYNYLNAMPYLEEKFPKLSIINQQFSPENVLKRLPDNDKRAKLIQAIKYSAESSAVNNTAETVLGMSTGALAIGSLAAAPFYPAVATALGMAATATVVLDVAREGLERLESDVGLLGGLPRAIFDLFPMSMGRKATEMAKSVKLVDEIKDTSFIDKILVENKKFAITPRGLDNQRINFAIQNLNNIQNVSEKTAAPFIAKWNDVIASQLSKDVNTDLHSAINYFSYEQEYLHNNANFLKSFTDYFNTRGFLTGDSKDLERVLIAANNGEKTVNIGSKVLNLTDEDLNVLKNFSSYNTIHRAGSIFSEALENKAKNIVISYEKEGETIVNSLDLKDANPAKVFDNYISSVLNGIKDDHVKVNFALDNDVVKTRVIRQNYVPTSDNFLVSTGKAVFNVDGQDIAVDIDGVATPLSTPERVWHNIEIEGRQNLLKTLAEKEEWKGKDLEKLVETATLKKDLADIKTYIPDSSVLPYKLRQTSQRLSNIANKLNSEKFTGDFLNKEEKAFDKFVNKSGIEINLKKEIDNLAKETETAVELIPNEIKPSVAMLKREKAKSLILDSAEELKKDLNNLFKKSLKLAGKGFKEITSLDISEKTLPKIKRALTKIAEEKGLSEEAKQELIDRIQNLKPKFSEKTKKLLNPKVSSELAKNAENISQSIIKQIGKIPKKQKEALQTNISKIIKNVAEPEKLAETLQEAYKNINLYITNKDQVSDVFNRVFKAIEKSVVNINKKSMVNSEKVLKLVNEHTQIQKQALEKYRQTFEKAFDRHINKKVSNTVSHLEKAVSDLDTFRKLHNEKPYNFIRIGQGFALKFTDIESQQAYLISHYLQPHLSSMKATSSLKRLYDYINIIEKHIGEDNVGSFIKATKQALSLVLDKPQGFEQANKVLGNLFTMFKPAIAFANNITSFILLHKTIPSLSIFKAAEFGKTLSSEYQRFLLGKGIYSFNKYNPLALIFNTTLDSHIIGNLKNASESQLLNIAKDVGRTVGREDEEFIKKLVTFFKNDTDNAAKYIMNLVSGLSPVMIHSKILQYSPILRNTIPWFQFIATPLSASLNIIKNYSSLSEVDKAKFLGKGLGMSVLGGIILGEGGIPELAPVETALALTRQLANAITSVFGEDAIPNQLQPVVKSENPLRDLALTVFIKDKNMREEMLKGYGEFIIKHYLDDDVKFASFISKGLKTIDALTKLTDYNILSQSAGSVYADIPTPVINLITSIGINFQNIRANIDDENSVAKAWWNIGENLVPVLRNFRETLYGKDLVKGLYTEESNLQKLVKSYGFNNEDKMIRDIGVLHLIGFAATFADGVLDNDLIHNALGWIKDVEEGKLGSNAKRHTAYLGGNTFLRGLDLSGSNSYKDIKTVNFILDKVYLSGDKLAYLATLNKVIKTSNNVSKDLIKATQELNQDVMKKKFTELNNIAFLLSQQKGYLKDNDIIDKKLIEIGKILDTIREVAKNKYIEIGENFDYNDYIKLYQKEG